MRKYKINRTSAITIAIGCFLFLMSMAVNGKAVRQVNNGKALYETHCARCHGEDGTKGLIGAKNLKKSVMSDSSIQERIMKGKRFMPAFRKKLTAEEIVSIAGYVKNMQP